MSPSPNPEAFHQEIADLEAKLAAKKQELTRSGIETPEKAVFKQVLREHVSPGEQARVVVPTTSTTSTIQQTTQSVTPAQQQKANLLIAHAFTKGLVSAIDEAKKSNDPYFIDLLHDRLADEYYQKLLAARKIQPE